MNAEYPAYYAFRPSSMKVEQPRMDNDRRREAVRSAVDTQKESLQSQIENAQKEAEKARVRTAFSLGGPTLMKAITGAPVETGYREQRRRQYEMEQRANEIERNASMKEAELQAQAKKQLAELEQEENLFNQKAETKEQQSVVDAQAQALDQLNKFAQKKQQWGRVTAQMAQDWRKAQQSAGNKRSQTLLDIWDKLGDNPANAANPLIVQTLKRAGIENPHETIRGFVQGLDGPSDPVDIQSQLQRIQMMREEGVEPVEAPKDRQFDGKYVASDEVEAEFTNDPSKAKKEQADPKDMERLDEREGMLYKKMKGMVGQQMSLARSNESGKQLLEAAQMGYRNGMFSDQEFQRLRTEAEKYGLEEPNSDAGRGTLAAEPGRIAPSNPGTFARGNTGNDTEQPGPRTEAGNLNSTNENPPSTNDQTGGGNVDLGIEYQSTIGAAEEEIQNTGPTNEGSKLTAQVEAVQSAKQTLNKWVQFAKENGASRFSRRKINEAKKDLSTQTENLRKQRRVSGAVGAKRASERRKQREQKNKVASLNSDIKKLQDQLEAAERGNTPEPVSEDEKDSLRREIRQKAREIKELGGQPISFE